MQSFFKKVFTFPKQTRSLESFSVFSSLGTIIVTIIGMYVLFNIFGSGLVLASQNSHNNNSQGLLHKHFKSVCDLPSKHHAKCFSQVITDENLHPLATTTPPSTALTPLQLHIAYNLPCSQNGPVTSPCAAPSSFANTIAIITAYQTPTLESDLNVYSSYYGLPPCTVANGCLQIIDQNGGTNLPTTVDQQWSLESSLDVQTVHQICQTCKILVIEANSNDMTDLATAVSTAASMNVYAISNSYGASEWPTETNLDIMYDHPGMAVVAASGDSGFGTAYPAADPNVISVGGTQLELNTDNTYNWEAAWYHTGSGCSAYETANLFQQYLSNWGSTYCGTQRAMNDIAAVGDPYTGIAIYDSTPYSGQTGWYQIGGTSLSSPIIAASFGLTDKISPSLTGIDVIYSNNTSANLHSHTIGSNGTCHTIMCNGTTIYDGPTGIGSPNGLAGLAQSTATSTAYPVPTIPVPQIPQNLTATPVSSTSVQLSWDKVPESGMYYLYRDGTSIIEGNISSYLNQNLTPNTTYTYSVQFQDSYGDLSHISSGVPVTTLSDTTPTPTSTPTPTPTSTPTPTPTNTPTPTPTPIPTYMLTGTVYTDSNSNGIQDAGESGYSGLTVSLNTGQTAVTDSNGNYTISQVVAGTYTVTLSLPSGYISTTTNPVDSLPIAANTTQNFGINPAPTPTPTSTPTPTPTPPAAPQVVEAGCISGPVTGTNNLSISWSSPSITWANIQSAPSTNTYFDKDVTGTNSTSAPIGFAGASSDVLGQALVIVPNRTYYASIWDGSTNLLSPLTAFTLPSCPPAVSITNPQDGTTFHKNSTVQMSANVVDYEPISQVQFYVNNSLLCSDKTAPYSCSWNAGKQRASYTLKAVATDTLGNTGNNSVSINVN